MPIRKGKRTPVGDRERAGDRIGEGIGDKMGDDVYRLGIVALDRLGQLIAKYDLKLSLDLKKPYGIRFGLEPKP